MRVQHEQMSPGNHFSGGSCDRADQIGEHVQAQPRVRIYYLQHELGVARVRQVKVRHQQVPCNRGGDRIDRCRHEVDVSDSRAAAPDARNEAVQLNGHAARQRDRRCVDVRKKAIERRRKALQIVRIERRAAASMQDADYRATRARSS